LIRWLASIWFFGTLLSTAIAGVRLSERMLLTSGELTNTIIWRWFVAPPLVLAIALAILGAFIATRQQMKTRAR